MPRNDDGFIWYSGDEALEEPLAAVIERMAEAMARRRKLGDHIASEVWPEDDPDIWKRLGLEKPHD